MAAFLIAHEKWAFLAEYAPVVTLVAVIGAVTVLWIYHALVRRRAL